MSLGTKIYTWFKGNLVGSDELGNKYYCSSKDFKNLVSTFDKYNSTLFLLNIKEKKPEKNIATKVKIVIQGLGKFIIS